MSMFTCSWASTPKTFAATPVPSHAELAVAALEAGKHCFVEKPLATTAADAERAVEAAERCVEAICSFGEADGGRG